MADIHQSLVPLKNAKYHHILYYEFLPTTNSFYFPISSPLKTQTLISSFENKLSISTVKMPDLFTEKAYVDSEDNRNLNLQINEDFSSYNYAHKSTKNRKTTKFGINEYLTLTAPDFIYNVAFCKESLNLIASKSNNIYIYDYTLYSQNSSLKPPCKTLNTSNTGFGLDWNKYLVSTGLDKEILIYDIHTDTERIYKTASENSCIKNLEDLCIFTGDDKNLSLLDIRTNTSNLYALPSEGYSVDLNFKNFVAVGMRNSSVIFDMRKLEVPFWEFKISDVKKEGIFSIVRFNPHTDLLLNVFTDGLVFIHTEKELKYKNDFQQNLHNADWNPLQFGEFVISGEINSTVCLPSVFL